MCHAAVRITAPRHLQNLGNHTSPHYPLTLQSATLGGRSLGATMATASCALPPPSRKPDAGLTCRAGHEEHALMNCRIGRSDPCSTGWVLGNGTGSCRQTAHGHARAQAPCSKSCRKASPCSGWAP